MEIIPPQKVQDRGPLHKAIRQGRELRYLFDIAEKDEQILSLKTKLRFWRLFSWILIALVFFRGFTE